MHIPGQINNITLAVILVYHITITVPSLRMGLPPSVMMPTRSEAIWKACSTGSYHSMK
jgi:hypothetical protein